MPLPRHRRHRAQTHTSTLMSHPRARACTPVSTPASTPAFTLASLKCVLASYSGQLAQIPTSPDPDTYTHANATSARQRTGTGTLTSTPTSTSTPTPTPRFTFALAALERDLARHLWQLAQIGASPDRETYTHADAPHGRLRLRTRTPTLTPAFTLAALEPPSPGTRRSPPRYRRQGTRTPTPTRMRTRTSSPAPTPTRTLAPFGCDPAKQLWQPAQIPTPLDPDAYTQADATPR